MQDFGSCLASSINNNGQPWVTANPHGGLVKDTLANGFGVVISTIKGKYQ